MNKDQYIGLTMIVIPIAVLVLLIFIFSIISIDPEYEDTIHLMFQCLGFLTGVLITNGMWIMRD